MKHLALAMLCASLHAQTHLGYGGFNEGHAEVTQNPARSVSLSGLYIIYSTDLYGK